MVNTFIKREGFVILELVVVLAIIALISGIMFISLKTGKQSLALDRAAHKVAQDIRKTAELALRSKPYTCIKPGSFSSGYGMRFDDPDVFYIRFADCNGNKTYQPSDDKIEETITLEDGVRIQSVTAGALHILFIPPNPEIFINGSSAVNPGQIVLELKSNPSVTRTITVNNKGMIRVD